MTLGWAVPRPLQTHCRLYHRCRRPRLVRVQALTQHHHPFRATRRSRYRSSKDTCAKRDTIDSRRGTGVFSCVVWLTVCVCVCVYARVHVGTFARVSRVDAGVSVHA